MNSHALQDFRVAEEDRGTDLLSFLAKHLPTSRGKAKQLLDDRCVFVNGRRVWMARHVVRPGQSVAIGAANASDPPGKAVSVLYEDPDYAVVNKPSGRLSNDGDSVESDLRTHWNEPSLLAVHRLDKDTTGCLLLARSRQAFDAAVEIFRRQHMNKSYHAIVAGRMPPEPMTIAKPVDGLPAVTHCRVLDARPAATHLLVKIDTGRTHQIRKHLAGAGFPVIGDRHYATRRNTNARAMKVGRQMLHASDLSFVHPITGRKVHIRAPLPRDFRNCLKMFGLT